MTYVNVNRSINSALQLSQSPTLEVSISGRIDKEANYLIADVKSLAKKGLK